MGAVSLATERCSQIKAACFAEVRGVFKADWERDCVKGVVCQCAQGVGLILACLKKQEVDARITSASSPAFGLGRFGCRAQLAVVLRRYLGVAGKKKQHCSAAPLVAGCRNVPRTLGEHPS